MATSDYSNGRIITNVGYVVDASTVNRGVVYLGCIEKNGVNKYFLATYRAAFTDPNGVAKPAGFVYLDYAISQAPDTAALFVVIASGVKTLISNDIVNQDICDAWSALKPQFTTNGATIAALAANLQAIPPGVGNAYPTMPTNGSRIGDGLTEEQVDALLGINNDILPNNPIKLSDLVTGGTGGTTGLVSTQLAAYSLDKAPTQAISALIDSPVEYAKENPISTAVIAVGAWDLVANLTGAFKPLIVGNLIFKKKGRKARR